MKRLFFLCAFLIAYFTLHPWTFLPFHEHTVILEGLRPLVGKSGYLDVVVNLCFYVPLGALAVLAWWRGSGAPAKWIATAAVGAGLSLILETIQAWVPSRDSSILDVLTNTIGTIAGARIGLIMARRVPSSSRWGLPPLTHPMPAVLIVAWLISQWFPFLPIMRIPRFVESVHGLLDVSSLGWIDLADAFVAALLVGRLLRAVLTSSAVRLALLGACLVLPARLLIVVGAVPWPLAIAVAAGLLVSDQVLARTRAETRTLAIIAMLLLVARELEPFHFSSAAGSFHWVPFSGFLGATRDSAIRVTAGKFFLYGATVWMVREAGASIWIAAVAVSGLLLAGESVQRYLPDRIAESTDPLLAVVAACGIAWLKDRPPGDRAASPGPPRDRRVPMSRILVVCYSRTGRTRLLATKIAAALDAEFEEIIDPTPRSGIAGYLRSGRQAWFRRVVPIVEAFRDPAGYDLVVIGTPIWNASLSAPVRSYLRRYGPKLRNVAFFLTCGGFGIDRVFRQMVDEAGRPPAARLAVRERELGTAAMLHHVDRFAAEARAASVHGAP